jgi:hypothetical protein
MTDTMAPVLGGAALAMSLISFVFVARAAAPAGRYQIGTGTVYDTKTKLTWQQTVSSGTYTFDYSGSSSTSAQVYCASLSLSGGGWRVPTMKELPTLVDYSVASPGPTIDASAFPNTPAVKFWSATPFVLGARSVWLVDFSSGARVGAMVTTSTTMNVRCVR